MFPALLLAVLVARAPVPFTLVNDHVYVDVTLDGKGPYHFIFDSGGSNLIDPAVAAELGLPQRGQVRIGGVGDGTQTARLATVASVRVGDAELDDQRFVVTPARATFGASEGPVVDGLIGAEFLNAFVTTVDYERRELRFDETAPFDDGANVLPVSLVGGHPRVPCRIDAVVAVCALDTGSRLGVSVLGPFARAHPAVVPAELSALGVDGYGLGGPALGRLGHIASLGFGDATIPAPLTDFSAQRAGAFSDPTLGANIGGAVLRAFTITFDYARRRVALVRNAFDVAAEPVDRSGLFVIGRDDRVVVLDARPGTAGAAAGLAKDDLITAIDGTAVGARDLAAIRARLMGAAGTTVRLTVTIPGTLVTRNVSLVLRDVA